MPDDVTAMAREILHQHADAWATTVTVKEAVSALEAAIITERERCAKVAENWNPGRKDRLTEKSIAYAIRSIGAEGGENG